MNDEKMPEGEEVRLMAVPITDAFAQAAAEVLREYREMVEKSLARSEKNRLFGRFRGWGYAV